MDHDEDPQDASDVNTASINGPIHTVTNSYEPNRDLLDLKQNKVGTTTISSYDYAVNAIGQRTGVATSGTAYPAVPSWLWSYDALGQVIRADSNVNTSDRSYQYDAIGNRQKSANSLTLPTTNNYTTNALNQYSTIQQGGTGVSPVYDTDGNSVSYPLPVSPTTNSTLAWDAENRLISNLVGNLTTSYQYGALSRRIAKFTGITPNSAATLYLYDDWNCIAEYSKTAGTVPVFALAKTQLWGTDLSGKKQGAGGVGGLLAVNTGSVRHFPTYDGNGNVSEYLTSTGTIAAHFEYDPFGNAVVNTDSSNQFSYRFSTKSRDKETGLYYYGYRYYDPMTGRWISRDPIEEMGGINEYSFVTNNTLSWFDILGNKPGTSDKSAFQKEREKKNHKKAVDKHRNRNKHNKCPQKQPKGGCDKNGNGWKDEGKPGLHGGQQTFRGTGSNSGSQCSYDENGNLDNEGGDQGTFDYNDPYGGDGEFDFPGDIGNLAGHLINDVIPHIGDSSYGTNQTTTRK